VNNALVIGNKQIKAGITGTGSEGFYQLFRYRWDGDISNGDSVEWMEVMYDTEEASVTFDYAEPPGTISGIGRFIRTGCYFVTDDSDKLIVETRRDGDILVDPRRMQDGWDVNWREGILPELSFFLFHPR
jgi:hypothetical protein